MSLPKTLFMIHLQHMLLLAVILFSLRVSGEARIEIKEVRPDGDIILRVVATEDYQLQWSGDCKNWLVGHTARVARPGIENIHWFADKAWSKVAKRCFYRVVPIRNPNL